MRGRGRSQKYKLAAIPSPRENPAEHDPRASEDRRGRPPERRHSSGCYPPDAQLMAVLSPYLTRRKNVEMVDRWKEVLTTLAPLTSPALRVFCFECTLHQRKTSLQYCRTRTSRTYGIIRKSLDVQCRILCRNTQNHGELTILASIYVFGACHIYISCFDNGRYWTNTVTRTSCL